MWLPILIMVIGPSRVQPVQLVMNKSHSRFAAVQFCVSLVWLQTELDNSKSYYQLIKTITKFEKETRHRLYVFIKKTQVNSVECATIHAHMMRSVHLHSNDVLTVPLTVHLHYSIKSMTHALPLSVKVTWFRMQFGANMHLKNFQRPQIAIALQARAIL